MSEHAGGVAATGADTTRERLIEAITVDGPIAAGDLAERFCLTGAAVRRHLSQLEAEGIIEEHESATKVRSRGRPRKEFVLAPTSSAHETSESDTLAIRALTALEGLGGGEALLSLAKARTSEWEKEFFARLEAEENERGTASPALRARLLVDLLTELGYAASLRPITVKLGPGAGGAPRTHATVQLCQGRCPVQDVAAVHSVLCDAETASISRMLGTPVQRLATRAAGAHVCTMHLTPAMSEDILAAHGEDRMTHEVTQGFAH